MHVCEGTFEISPLKLFVPYILVTSNIIHRFAECSFFSDFTDMFNTRYRCTFVQ